jgi:hypothetical protein
MQGDPGGTAAGAEAGGHNGIAVCLQDEAEDGAGDGAAVSERGVDVRVARLIVEAEDGATSQGEPAPATANRRNSGRKEAAGLFIGANKQPRVAQSTQSG